MAVLLLNARRIILKYDPNMNLDPGKKYLAIGQNTSGIFLTDPYYSGNFEVYLADDIRRIIGIQTDEGQNKQRWHNFMPKLIVIPLISGMHWRTIVIQINYTNFDVTILYDDPYGRFPDRLKEELLPSIKQSCQMLIKKHNEIKNLQIDADFDIKSNENHIDQQGPNNHWDCGPITLINVQDYVSHFIHHGDLNQVEYSIGRHDVDIENHEKILKNFRIDHIKKYSQISKIETERLKKMEEAINKEKDNKKSEIIGKFENTEKIQKLNDFYLGMYFNVLDGMQFDTTITYEESMKYALQFVEKEQLKEKIKVMDGPKVPGDKIYNEDQGDENSQLKPDETLAILDLLKPNLVINKETDDFINFIQNQSVYIDKSLLIKEIINSGHIFITAPQRWGKSLNLSMIKAFFQPDGDDPSHYDENGKYDFSRGNKNENVFKGLKIAGQKLQILMDDKDGKNFFKEIDIIQEYQGKFPVIYLNFKAVHDFENEQELNEKLRFAVSDAFQQHEYWYKRQLINILKTYKRIKPGFIWSDENIENSDLRTLEDIIMDNCIDLDDDLKTFQAYCNGKITAEAPLHRSIIFLCQILYEHYGRKILILVDEFDKPVISLLPSFLEKLSNSEIEQQSQTYMIKVAKAATILISDILKGSSGIMSQVILTGIFNSLDKSLVNGVMEIAITDSDHASTKYFGFDDKDIQTICDSVLKEGIGANFIQKLKDRLKYWYNGQQVCGKKMYIPSSVMEYFTRLNKSRREYETLPKFMCYWEQTQTINLLTPILDAMSKDLNFDNYLQKLKDIVLGNYVQLPYDSQQSLISITKNMGSDPNSLETIFSHLLIKTGYLTVKDSYQKTYGYPAQEIRKMIEKVIMVGWCKKVVFKENWDKFHQIAKNTNFCSDDVSQNIGKAINLVKSTYENFNESTFKCILHRMFTSSDFKIGVTISIEAWAGRGYIDFVLYSKTEVKIIELKFLSDATDDQIKQLMETAKWQIPEQGYLSLVLRNLCEESKKDICQIKLVPMLLFRCGNNADWQCKSNNDELVLTIEEAKLIESFFNLDDIKTSLGFKRIENGQRWKHMEGRDSHIEDLRTTLLEEQKVADFEGLIKKIKEFDQINDTMKKEGDSYVQKNPRDEEIRKLLHSVKKEEKQKAFKEIQQLISNKGENLQTSDIIDFKCSVKGIGKSTKEALWKVILEAKDKSETKTIFSKKRKLVLPDAKREKKFKTSEN